MTNDVEAIYGESELFAYLQWIRLSTAKRLNDQKKADNETIEGQGFKNFGKKIRSAIGRYEAKDSAIETSINAYIGSGHAFQDSDGAKQALVRLFASDFNGVLKLLFGVKVAVDNDYNYQYEKEGLKEASVFLFNDENQLQRIRDELEANYKAIAKRPLSTLQKAVLGTVIATSIVTSIVVPVLGANAIASNTAGISLTLRSAGLVSASSAITTIRVASILCASALIAGTYIGMEVHNKNVVKEQFKKISPDENDMYLAIQCLIIKHLRNKLSEHDFKNELDSMLQSLNNLKGDLDYYLFVEKEDIKDNTAKLNSFHGFDQRLIKVLDI